MIKFQHIDDDKALTSFFKIILPSIALFNIFDIVLVNNFHNDLNYSASYGVGANAAEFRKATKIEELGIEELWKSLEEEKLAKI